MGPAKLLTFGAAGFLIGITMGYIFMGTIHAVRSSILRGQSLQVPWEEKLGLLCFSLIELTMDVNVQMLQLREETTQKTQAGACTFSMYDGTSSVCWHN